MGTPHKDAKAIPFLRSLIGCQQSDCVLWPFAMLPTGYGHLGFNRKVRRAHRVMCELAHGAPPTPLHHAAHACGNKRCVNPNHLAWKTSSQNQLDRRKHGTARNGSFGQHGKLTPAQRQEIREARGRVTQAVLAKKFGVVEGTIRGIQSGKWGKPERKSFCSGQHK